MTSFNIGALTQALAEKSESVPELVRLQLLVDAYERARSKSEALHTVSVAVRHGLLQTSAGERAVLFNYLSLLTVLVSRVKSKSVSHLEYVHALDNMKTLSVLTGLAIGRHCAEGVRDKALEALRAIGATSETLWPGMRSLAHETVRHMQGLGMRFPRGPVVDVEERRQYEGVSSSVLLLYSVSSCALAEGRERELQPLVQELLRAVRTANSKTYERKRVLRLAGVLETDEQVQE